MNPTSIVCTCNCAESLRGMLRVVAEEVQRDWPLLRHEFEGAQCLSHPRNHGIG